MSRRNQFSNTDSSRRSHDHDSQGNLGSLASDSNYNDDSFEGRGNRGESRSSHRETYASGPYPGDRYQGDRYQGDRYQGDRYQGDRYQGDRYQGDRYQGDRYQGDRYSSREDQGQGFQQYRGDGYQRQGYQDDRGYAASDLGSYGYGNYDNRSMSGYTRGDNRQNDRSFNESRNLGEVRPGNRSSWENTTSPIQHAPLRGNMNDSAYANREDNGGQFNNWNSKHHTSHGYGQSERMSFDADLSDSRYQGRSQYGNEFGQNHYGQMSRQDGSAGQSSASKGRAPKNYTRTDSRIREDICETLESRSSIDASEIEVEVKDGEVTLTGTVPQRSIKLQLEAICDGISGVKDVHNRVRVVRDGGQSSERSESASTAGASSTGMSGKSSKESSSSKPS